MNALLMTSWLCLPIAPLNPIEEDTLASTNLHFSTGVVSPNDIVSVGPVVSAKYEMLMVHPFMMRATVDFEYGRITSYRFPQGNLYSMMFGTDAIYYRGTNRLTGYIGFGLVYALHHFVSFQKSADSLLTNEGVTSVDLEHKLGYRLTLGLRYHKSYSLEISVVEIRPSFKKTGVDARGGETRSYLPIRTSGFRITIGYLFEI